MTPEQVEALIRGGCNVAEMGVQSNGNHYDIAVVSDDFVGLNAVKRQQLLYALVREPIAAGTMHAVNFKTYTLEEWQQAQRMGLA
ncbi:BolA family protein [Isoalcanivorax beigongshangi]|uniref:BolA family protein n=1 Tax=Isoalcanivorax beigongshangi TaxID=3238810 RepID=A0ABV4ALL6_9GAMM